MATKWKKFTRRTSTKVVAFALAVVSSFGLIGFGLAAVQQTDQKELTAELIFNRYAWYQQAQSQAYLAADCIYKQSYQTADEQSIRNGDTIAKEDLLFGVYADAYLEGVSYDATTYQALTDEQIDRLRNDMRTVIKNYNDLTTEDEAEAEVDDVLNWLKRHPKAYNAVKQNLIQEELSNYLERQNQTSLDLENYKIFAKTDGETSGNSTREEVQNCPLYAEFTPNVGKLLVTYSGNVETYQKYTEDFNKSESIRDDSNNWNTNDVIAVGIDAAAFSKMETEAFALNRTCTWYLCGVAVCGLLLLLSLILLCLSAGWTATGEKPARIGFDRIWTEVQIVWVVFVFGMALAGVEAAISYTSNSQAEMNMYYLVPALLAGLTALLCLPCLQSQARNCKTKNFWNGFVIFRALKWLLAQWCRGPLYIKVIVGAIVLPLVCMIFGYAFPPLVFAIIIGGLFFGVRFAEDFKHIHDGARDIRSGATGSHIEVRQKDGQLKELAEDLNRISDGLQNAVQTQLKSERLKTELISNVSHDLKTPLTGIVTYVDLMKQCDPSDPKMQEYLQVVDQKTKRLSTLINDILEASKASSGAMKTDLTRVDWKSLFGQTCGELEDKIKGAGLEVRLKTSGRTDIKADGRMLWRVMENLVINCTRYAVPDSRVYAELTEQGKWCIFSLKNISAQELNISADELMERFTRGDRARYTEGSGLGLSIAKSLTELMGGQFEITIDGDLFKAEVYMPLWTE